jgi:glycosyltransferase involved in cell wall biosynthesis
MKIAFDATALYGARGGIENALWNTFIGLRALDTSNEYLVYVPRDAPQPPSPPNSRWQWHFLPFDGQDKARRIFWQQLQLPFWLRRERCDLLHSWNYVMPLMAPVPTLLTVQDLIALDRPAYATRFNRWHYRAIMPQSLKRAARVITTTEKTKTAVLRRAPKVQLRVVPLGVEPLFFEAISSAQKEAVRRKYALPERFLLYVGNFEPKKNLPALLRVVRSLPDAPPLVLAGGIKPWPEIEKLLAGTKRIGFVEREELPALYASCTAFCFPSRCEGFGLPVVEALACGAPTLASTEVPLPHLASVATLCQPRFPRSIAQQLETLLGQPNSKERIEARRAYASQFRWDRAARQTLDIYREFL